MTDAQKPSIVQYLSAPPSPMSRVETGVVQFADDWPGIFIRGDNALMSYLPALTAVLEAPNVLSDRPFDRMALEGLKSLLSSCAYASSPG